ncbi:DUF5979 domain-containing protein [Cellulosimicrobium marinum]|uniref:DUF5979 domain-containing protein n=1 Tax=Cellulosimicrobium marinum TaxID=1638992 RepID=UPI001E55D6A7|nr:DUF5979 domain-containing protein [Cellulosimicrobium marinum]
MAERRTADGTTRAGRTARQRRARRLRQTWAAVGTALLALPLALVPAAPAAAASWGIQKQALSQGPYTPGDEVQWVVTVSCSDPNADPCVPTTITDPLPDGIELVSASVQNQSGATNGSLDPDTETDTVTYTADSVNNGGQVQILINAVVDPDIPYAADGVPITNTATVVSDNAPANQASNSITPTVPLNLDSATTKEITPEGAIASPGTPALVTLGATNTSNDPVDSLVLSEPVDPAADPNPFTYLEFTGFGPDGDGTGIAWPEGATGATVTFTCADGSTPSDSTTTPDTLPNPPDGCVVEGFTVEFTGDIAIGATASIPFATAQSAAVTQITDETIVTNDTASSVIRDGTVSTPVEAEDTYVLTPPNNTVTATKSFDPATVSAGASSTVTIGATNAGDPTTGLSITEPSPGTDSPFEGDDPLTFTGWGTADDPGVVQWPTGADGASVTYTCADGSTPTVDATEPNTLPDPPGGCTVVGFTVSFTGDIVTGAEASLPFQVDTDPDQVTDDVTHPNEITATIPNDSSTADASLVTLTDRLATSTTKSISPSTIPALPGQTVVVGLPTQLLPFGPDGSTTGAEQIVVQDPTDPGAPGEFWDSFTASSVRSTGVPAGTALTVNYWDGTAWVEAPGCGSPVQGSATVNCDLPDGAQGVQFVYEDTTGDGIPPGTSVSPNFVAAYDGPQDQDDPVENCGASSASADTVAPTAPAEGCDTVDPFPVPTEPGDLDFIAKAFLAPDGQTGTPYTVRARTQDEITARVTWSTNGFENVDPMVISDLADPVAADDPGISDSFYDAFDLVSVALDDPLLQYDQVESVELYIDGAWVEATDDPCPEACDGTFPGYTLTADEQEDATSVRLTYTESPGREQFPADPTEPAAGEGVARSTQADGRHLDLTFRLRDDRRSGGPALGRDQDEIYNNAEDPGLVTDTARGTATFNPPGGGDAVVRTDTDDDDVLIIDEPINVGISKTWAGGPLSVPPEGTPYEDFPTTVVTVTASNNSVARVDELRIAEPSSANAGLVVEPEVDPGTNPFDAFTLTDIIAVSPPDGTETTTVTLTTVGGTATDYTPAQAQALTVDELADVVGVEVTFDGRIASTETGNNEGVLEMRLKLRELDRYTGERVTVDHDPNPVPNSAGAEVSDPGGTTDQTPQAWATADMELQDAAISMEQTKSFDPPTVVEPGSDAEENPTSVLEITGQPQGPSRAVEMVLTDVDGSFWNQYDLVDFADTTFRAPIDQVQVDACTGGTYDEASDTFADCVWTDGEPSGTFALPGDVQPADVVGLRLTFTKADGTIWENPSDPTQVVHLTVQVRDTLRSDPGTPVPSDLAQNDPAPGETAPGLATNDVTATVTGADLVFNPEDPENPIPVSSTADATSTITYAHTENAVEIVKDFAGEVSSTRPPDGVFPMNITIRNTGNRPIYDPVVTDPMPTDPDGPQLRLAEVAEPYAFALDGAAPDPANGPAMPTDTDQVTIDRSGNIGSLTFTFPEGTVLEVGQTYTITVQVEFRVTLPAQTVVRNTAGVTGDRPWDECVSRLNDETGACEADADVTTVPAAVLAESKSVRSTDDEYPLGIIVDPDQPGDVQPEDCTPDAGGFYSYPCTPVIPPGENETWHIRVDNVGNLPIDTVVVYDRLPTPGDGPSYQGSPRGSQFTPILTNDAPPALVNAPAGAVATFYYTTVDDYCLDDIEDPLSGQTCSDDPDAGGWAPLPSGGSDALYASVTALKTVITFPADQPLRPGSFVALEGTSTTPPRVPEAGDRAIAFNSAAANGVGVGPAGGRFNMLTTEGVKVGVATAVGSLQVDKVVAGEAADLAPETFTMTVECTSSPGTWVETVLDPVEITVTPGAPTVVEDIPWGSECTVTEDGSDGQTRLVLLPESVIIDSETADDPVLIGAVNWYDLSSIVIDKEVVSDAVDQDGEPVVFGPFDGTVDCTFLGEPVYADGFGPDTPMTFELEDGESVEFDGLPVNAECTVTETGAGNASSTTITVRHGPLGEPDVTDGTTADLTLAGDLVGQPRNAVTLTNTYDVGVIDLQKVVDGEGAEQYGAGPFTIQVVCTFDDDDGTGPQTVYDGTVVLGGAGPLDAEIANLPAGAECTVTELDDAGATGAVVVPSTVVVDADEPAQVVVTNTFDVGSVQVDKELAGLGALYGPGPFEVELACTYEDVDLTIPGGATRELVPGEPVVYEGLPVGSQCTVVETETFGASSTTVAVDDGDPVEFPSGEVPTVDVEVPPADDGEPTTVTVAMTNTFLTAPLVVRKVVDGDGAAFAPPMPDLPPLPTTLEELADFDFSTIPFDEFPYAVSLECTTVTGAPVETIPGGPDRRFGPGFPALYFGLQDGDSCSVTETEIGGATSVAVDPDPVTIVGAELPADPVEVVVTNTYDTGSVEVAKVVTGDGAEAFGAGPFEVSLACTFEGADVAVPGGAERTVTGGEVAVYDGLPIDADCVVTETATGGAHDVEVSSVDGGEPGAATVGAEPVAITVTNTFDVAEVVVTKELVGPGAAEHEGDAFTVLTECTWEVDGGTVPVDVPGGGERTLSAADDWTATYVVPQGASCTVAETDAGDAVRVTLTAAGEETTVDPADGVPTTGAFDVGTGVEPSVSVTVANAFPATPADLPPTGARVVAAVLAVVVLVGLGVVVVAAARRREV